MAELPGAAGPHPDLVPLIVAMLAEGEEGRVVAPERVQILQQRTIFDRPHPRRGRTDQLAIASCLALVRGGDGPDTLVLIEAAREEGAERWGMMGLRSMDLSDADATRAPFTAAASVLPRAGVNIGALVADSDIAALRVELADGRAFEDAVTGGSMLVLAPFDSPAAWARDAVVRLLDRQGAEIASQAVYVHPDPPPGTPIPRPAAPPQRG